MNHTDGDVADIFISYAHTNEPWVRWLAGRLEAMGVRTIYMARDFHQGDWPSSVNEALEKCQCMIAILSPAYLMSPWTKKELAAAYAAQKLRFLRVVPCNLPDLYATEIYLDISGDCEEDAVEKIVSRAPRWLGTHDLGPVDANEPQDSQVFPGRCPEVAKHQPRFSLTPTDASSWDYLKPCIRVEIAGVKRPVLGKIALMSQIGQFGANHVYHGVRLSSGEEVAVKVLNHTSRQRRPYLRSRLQQEEKFGAHLRSARLVQVFDLGRDEKSDCWFLAMEYVQGQSAKRLFRFNCPGPDDVEANALDVCVAACQGLAMMHDANVIHRNIKPSHLLIPDDQQGSPWYSRAKLTDLGLALGGHREPYKNEDPKEAIEGEWPDRVGTLGYISPEQLCNPDDVWTTADVFAVGATLYDLLSGGDPPFTGNDDDKESKTSKGSYRPIRELNSRVSADTANLIDDCLAQKVDNRPRDASELLDQLRRCRELVGGSPLNGNVRPS